MVFRIEKAISRPRGYAHLILDALITKQSDWTSHLSTKPYLFVDESLILLELSTKPCLFVDESLILAELSTKPCLFVDECLILSELSTKLFVDETRYDLTLGELVIPYNQAIS